MLSSKTPAVQKIRDYYAMTPGAPLLRREFGFYVLDRWIAEGHLPPRDGVADYDALLRERFGYDTPADYAVGGLGWCEAALQPAFEPCVLEDRGEYELIRDNAGRGLLVFKGRRSGFMPEYLTHPVTDRRSWEENVRWRLDPNTPAREALSARMISGARAAASQGRAVVQRCIGGYMYLRSLIGPGELPYMFYDDPELLHDCMRTWFTLADAIIERHQRELDFDELFLGEDICYKGGALISPDMMREFLLPYYSQLYTNMLRRRRDPSRPIHFQIDTDGRVDGVIDLYREIGVDTMSPFEVAAGNDSVAIAARWPELRMTGAIDKRAIAAGGDTLRRHLEAVVPPLRARGGYIPTCDHGVPEETPFEHYMLYRELMAEYCE